MGNNSNGSSVISGSKFNSRDCIQLKVTNGHLINIRDMDDFVSLIGHPDPKVHEYVSKLGGFKLMYLKAFATRSEIINLNLSLNFKEFVEESLLELEDPKVDSLVEEFYSMCQLAISNLQRDCDNLKAEVKRYVKESESHDLLLYCDYLIKSLPIISKSLENLYNHMRKNAPRNYAALINYYNRAYLNYFNTVNLMTYDVLFKCEVSI